jgi:hypothetical protein
VWRVCQEMDTLCGGCMCSHNPFTYTCVVGGGCVCSGCMQMHVHGEGRMDRPTRGGDVDGRVDWRVDGHTTGNSGTLTGGTLTGGEPTGGTPTGGTLTDHGWRTYKWMPVVQVAWGTEHAAAAAAAASPRVV